MTVVLVTCSYRNAEFCRVGYYVNNEYTEEYDEEAGPPKPVDASKVQRQILADKPRVTRFPIDWNLGAAAQQPEQQNLVTMEGGQVQGMQSPVPSLGAASTPSDNDVTPGNISSAPGFGDVQPARMEM